MHAADGDYIGHDVVEEIKAFYLRRTKAIHILLGTGDLETVRVLLGHAKLHSTSRFLRIAKKSDPIAISRAFDI